MQTQTKLTNLAVYVNHLAVPRSSITKRAFTLFELLLSCKISLPRGREKQNAETNKSNQNANGAPFAKANSVSLPPPQPADNGLSLFNHSSRMSKEENKRVDCYLAFQGTLSKLYEYLLLERPDDRQVVFDCLLNEDLPLGTRAFAARCVYVSAMVSRTSARSPLESIPNTVLAALSSVCEDCLHAAPDSLQRSSPWPAGKRGSEKEIERLQSLAREELNRRRSASPAR